MPGICSVLNKYLLDKCFQYSSCPLYLNWKTCMLMDNWDRKNDVKKVCDKRKVNLVLWLWKITIGEASRSPPEGNSIPHDFKGHIGFPRVKKVRKVSQAAASVSEVGRYVPLYGSSWEVNGAIWLMKLLQSTDREWNGEQIGTRLCVGVVWSHTLSKTKEWE